MTDSTDVSIRYALLGDNQFSIDEGTDAKEKIVEEIESLFESGKSIKKNLKDVRFRLYILAASLHQKFKSRTKTSEKKAFDAWYKRRGLDKVFGESRANFIHYAQAGYLVNYIATAPRVAENGSHSDPAEDLAKLPSSMLALYELHKVKKTLFDKKEEKIFWALFVSTPRRKSPTDEAYKFDPEPLIHDEDGEQSATTTKEIAEWLEAWKGKLSPSEFEKANPSVTHKDMTVRLATIYAHKSIFSFDRKTGEADGRVSLAELQTLIKELNAILPTGKNKVRIEDEMPKISQRYEKHKKRTDPAKDIVTKKR